MVLQRILHGECLDELLRTNKTQSVLKAENNERESHQDTDNKNNIEEKDDQEESEMNK